MPAFDVSIECHLDAVVRGARDEAHALQIIRALAEQFANASECLDGDAYGQPLVTEFSLNLERGTDSAEPLNEEDDEWRDSLNASPAERPAGF